MRNLIHEIIAAAGGLLFIIFGIARQRERKRLAAAGVKTEGPLLWDIFIVSGFCLIVFAVGVIIYRANLG